MYGFKCEWYYLRDSLNLNFNVTKRSKMEKYLKVIFMLSCFLIVTRVNAEHGNERIIAGWLETIILSPQQIKLRAKLDTGAKTSSIHAENIVRFEREGKSWLRFDLPKGKSKKAIQHTIEVPLLKEVLIKRHKLPSVSRPVVELSFCINKHYYTSPFTLSDRGNYNYPVLLGRRFLKNNILVDSAESFMYSNKNICQKVEQPVKLKKLPSLP